MKKIIVAVITLFTISGSCFAQAASSKMAATDKSKPVVTSVKEQKKAPATTNKMAVVKPTPAVADAKATPATATKATVKPAQTATVATSATPLKKDGTPDKRYKAAKAPVKKDGTLDMRYKENKPKAKS